MEKYPGELYTGRGSPPGMVYGYAVPAASGLSVWARRIPDGTLMQVEVFADQAPWMRMPLATRKKMIDLMVREFTGVVPARLTMTTMGGNPRNPLMPSINPTEMCVGEVDESGSWNAPRNISLDCGWNLYSSPSGNRYILIFRWMTLGSRGAGHRMATAENPVQKGGVMVETHGLIDHAADWH